MGHVPEVRSERGCVVTLPSENQARGEAPTVAKLQQTVEAALFFHRAFDCEACVADGLRAALRDLAAKAELAEELGEALRESFTYWPATPEQFLEFPPEHDRVKRIIGPLARLDGVGE